MTPFWMVCRAPRHEHSKTEPRQRFATRAEAAEAAQALADQTGEVFVILQSEGLIRPRDGQSALF